MLYGDDADQTGFESGWHRDEPVFENLRINIPLVTHRSYKLQVEHILDKPDRRSETMSEHHLLTGYAIRSIRIGRTVSIHPILAD